MTDEAKKEILALRDRIAVLEKYGKMGREKVETYFLEDPKKTVCMTFLIGLGCGFLLGVMHGCCTEE